MLFVGSMCLGWGICLVVLGVCLLYGVFHKD